MGTASSTLGATAATFTGTSKYAADLQQAITHSLTIASLPVAELNRSVSTLQGQASELDTLQSRFYAVQTAMQSLASATGGGSLTASVADSTVATATLDSAAAISAGTYTLKVTNAGAPTTTLSNTGLPTVADPTTGSISSSSSFTLTVDGSPFTVNPAANSLNALAQAINQSGASVSASIVNIGSPAAPDYRLSLQSTTLGNIAIQLNDGSHDLLSNLSTGSVAQYQVDGLPSTPISSNTDTVTIAPGLTVNLQKAGQTDISVSQSPTAAANALSSFVAAYNSTVDELAVSHGSGGGALTGQSIVPTLQQSLRELVQYRGGSGTVQGLPDLGVSLDDHGKLTFNQAQFANASAAHPGDLAAFLGSASGNGFLHSATSILTALGDSATGTFHSVLTTVKQQIDKDNSQITTLQDNLTRLNNNLVAQMSAADALLASLQSQVSYFTLLFADTYNVKTG
jgi:flagellar hook-associated protein 2